MALATRADLLTEVANYLARAGDTEVTNNDDNWLQYAEDRIFLGAGGPLESPPLRCRANEAYQQIPINTPGAGATTAGSANAQTSALGGFTRAFGKTVTLTVGAGLTNTSALTLNIQGTGAVAVRKGQFDEALAAGDWRETMTYTVFDDGTNYLMLPGPSAAPLPSDWLEMRRVWLSTDPKRALDFHTPHEFHGEFGGVSPTTGAPTGYTVENDCIVFGLTPDTGYQAHFVYWRRLPRLVGASDTNWLLTNYFPIYLYATLLESTVFLGFNENAATWLAAYGSAIRGLNGQDERGIYPPAPRAVAADHSVNLIRR